MQLIEFSFSMDSSGSMKSLFWKMRRFLVSESGPTAVEYAVMLALIVVVCLASIRTIGTNAKTTFTTVASSLSGS
jgi:pilus assembly protein Flp/PilA